MARAVIPLHYQSTYLEDTLAGSSEPMSTLMRLTMSNTFPYRRAPNATNADGSPYDPRQAHLLWCVAVRAGGPAGGAVAVGVWGGIYGGGRRGAAGA
jgi:hypothetical protein